MNENETELRVQALVDGELAGTEADELRARIQGDDALRELHARLTAARGLMDGAELPRPLPEPGDFHWSQISEAIEREDRQARRLAKPSTRAGWLLSWLPPLAGAACILLLLTSPSRHDGPPDLGIMLGSDHELELSDDTIDVMTYNTGDDNMSIVWLDFSIDLRPDTLHIWLD
ncbi:MAG: hypothetical protein QF721_03060 [Verrucomicrobiota bacterium]|jgi:hypothetical protein|nr:hypothetical protein [Verrucomicrobiota bacterium]